MRTLRAYLADYPRPWLEGLAQWLGVAPGLWEPEEVAARLAAHLLQPKVFETLIASLSPAARAALDHVRGANPPLSWHAFVRLYGPVREMGPTRLLREQPWRDPQSPGEELVYRALVFRRLIQREGQWEEVALVPAEYALLLPPPAAAQHVRLLPCSNPETVQHAGDAFLEDFVTLVSFVYNEGMQVDREGRPLRSDLLRVGERFIEPLRPTDLLRPPPRVHLLFHHAYALGFLYREGNHLRVRFRRLLRWLRQPRAYQKFTLWRAWAVSAQWHDLWFVEDLELGDSGWNRSPEEPRRRILAQLASLPEGTWYRVQDVARLLWERDPDFYRQGGEYDSWPVRRRSDGRWLRGVEHWHEVEGALIRFCITGPLYWLGAAALGTLPEGESCFALTEAGSRWLRGRSEPMRQERPPARLAADLSVYLPEKVHPLDRFRISRFAEWEASRPQFRYRITRQSWLRGLKQGLPPDRIFRFLYELTNGNVPETVVQTLKHWTRGTLTSRPTQGG